MTNQVQWCDVESKQKLQFAIDEKSNKEIRKHDDGRILVIKISVKQIKDKYITNEIHYLSRIDHENIVKLYGDIKTSAFTGIILEHADNGTVYNFLYDQGSVMSYQNIEYTPNGRWKLESVSQNDYQCVSFWDKFSWMLQCAKGVAYLHGMSPKIFHNDLSIRHLLLSNNLQTLKICDFSTATEYKSLVPKHNERSLCAENTEIYKFGIILWETFIAKHSKQTAFDIRNVKVIEALVKLCCENYRINRPRMEILVKLLDSIYQQSLTNTDIVCWTDIEQIVELISSGSFGDVFKAVWKTKSGDKSIAIKKIKDIAQEVDVETELKYLSLVNHENIVSLFGAVKDCENKVNVVMEYAECGSLYGFLYNKPEIEISVLGKLNWMLQCAKGVAYLHGITPKPILHRDLKSLNLLLFNNYQTLKICDFGTARLLKTEMTNEVGTAGYMAPEVCNGDQYTEKCDVYSFGILCWEIMSRKKPFYQLECRKNLVIMNLTCKNKRPRIRDVKINKESKPIRAWIQKCWDPEPQNRPTMKESVLNLSVHPRSVAREILIPLPEISELDFKSRHSP